MDNSDFNSLIVEHKNNSQSQLDKVKHPVYSSPNNSSIAPVNKLDTPTLKQQDTLARIYSEQAVVYFQEGNWQEAIASCQKALQISPEAAEAYKVLGNILQRMGKKGKALGYYAKALEAKPDLAEVYANLGSFYAEQENWEQAIDYYHQALDIKPNFAGAYRNLALIWEEIGKTDRALECLCQAVKLNSKILTSEDYFLFGNKLYEEQKLKEASIFYIQGVKLKPNAQDEIDRLVKILEAIGEWQTAAEYYQKAIALRTKKVDSSDLALFNKPIKRLLTKSPKPLLLSPQKSNVRLLSQATRSPIEKQITSDFNIADKKTSAISQDKPESATSWNNLGSLYAKKQQWQKAISCYQEAIQLDANFGKTYRNLARVYAKLGQKEKATDCWYEGFSLEPDSASAEEHFYLGKSLWEQQKSERAIACFRHSIQLKPEFSNACLALGAIFKGQKKLEESKTCYLQIIKHHPHHFQAYFCLAQIATEQENWSETINFYQKAVALKPSNWEANYYLAEALSKKQKWSEAVAAYRSAIALKLDFSWAYHNLAYALQQQEKWQLAADAYRSAIALKSDFFWSYYNLGDTLSKLFQWDEAIASYRQAIELKPNAAEAHAHLGDAFARREEWDEAIASYRQAIEINPGSDVKVYQNLGEALSRQKKMAEVINLEVKTQIQEEQQSQLPLVEAENKLPEGDWQAIHSQGDECFQQENWERAVILYRQAGVLNPHSFWTYFNLGRALSQLGKLDEAVLSYQQAVKIEPDNFDAYYWLGDMLLKQNNWQEAENAYRGAVNVESSHGWTYFNLGFVLAQQNKLTEAAIEYQNALKVGTEDEDLCRMSEQALAGIKEREKTVVISVVESTETNSQPSPLPQNSGSWEKCQQLADSLRDGGDWERAITKYYQAINLDPNRFESYYWLSSLLITKQRWKEAEQSYRKAISIVAEHGWTHYNLGFTLVQQGQLDEALKAYLNAQQFASEDPELQRMTEKALSELAWWEEAKAITPWQAPHKLADFLREKGQIDRAIAAYRNALQINPDRVESYYCLGELLIERARWQEAEKAFRRIVELQPQNLQGYRNLVLALLEQSKLDEAIAIYQQAVALDCHAPDLINWFAEITRNISRRDEAVALQNHLTRWDNSSSWMHREMGNLLWQKSQQYLKYAMNSYHRAIRLAPDDLENYYKALNVKPNDASLYLELGNILAKQNQLGDATVAYHTALQIQPQNDIILFQLGIVLERQNKMPQAIECYQKAVILNPQEKAYLSRLQAVDLSGKSGGLPSFNVVVLKPAPKISIVTPSYNQGKFLEECIDSIISQGYPNLEYIVMDGGSTDNSVEIIKKYEKHITHWQSQPDKGQYHAINEGFGRTTGEIMGWLNSDDKYHPDAFFKIAIAFAKQENVEWITGKETKWNDRGECFYLDENPPRWDRQMMLRREQQEFMQQESTFWKRSLWNKSGATLRTDVSLAGDFELWLRFSRYAQVFGIDSPIGGFRYHGNQRSVMHATKYFQEVDELVKQELDLMAAGQYQNILPQAPIINISDREVASVKKLILS